MALEKLFAMVYLQMRNVKTYVLKYNVLLHPVCLSITFGSSYAQRSPHPLVRCSTVCAMQHFRVATRCLSIVHKLCFALQSIPTCRFAPVSIYSQVVTIVARAVLCSSFGHLIFIHQMIFFTQKFSSSKSSVSVPR